jgi:acetolactate synthase-1/3 small subunit
MAPLSTSTVTGTSPGVFGGELESAPVRLISVRVEDRAGVLQRITNCLERRGLRLHSCAVGQGAEGGVLSLWLRVATGSQPADQVVKQLSKLIDVVSVEDLTGQAPLEWTLALVEFSLAGREEQVQTAVERLRAQVVRCGGGRLVAALSGPPAVVEAALEELRTLPVLNWVCSRPLALAPSTDSGADAGSQFNSQGS